PPVVEVAGGGLHDPAGVGTLHEVEGDLVGGGGGGRHHRAIPAHHDRAVDVAADDAFDLRILRHEGAEGGAVVAVDAVHLRQAGQEGRVVHGDDGGAVGALLEVVGGAVEAGRGGG